MSLPKVHKLRDGGAIREPKPVDVHTSQSVKFGGSRNIALKLREEAEYLKVHSLQPLEALIYAKQQQRIKLGHGSKIPVKYQRMLTAVHKQISDLLREANAIMGEGHNVKHKVEVKQNFKLVKGVAK